MLKDCPVVGVAIKELYMWIDGGYIMGVTVQTLEPLSESAYVLLLNWLKVEYGDSEWVLSELADGNRD